jgi:hypothetical protein
MAQDHRAPGADVVDVAPAFDVPQPGAFGAADEARRAADGSEGAHRRIDAAGDDALRALEGGWSLRDSVDTARASLGFGGGRLVAGFAGGSAVFGTFLGRRQRPEEAVGHDVPMPGRKPASRLWSRKDRASPTAACSSLPAASSDASAADSVSPAPTKLVSKRSNFSPVRRPAAMPARCR